MFLFNNSPSENPDPLFCLTIGIGSQIDFCVWILQQDGLRVPPFNQHLDGDRSLRARGMTPEAWCSWVTRSTLLIDQRLLWQPTDLATEQQQDRDQFWQMQQQLAAEYPDLDFPPLDAAFDAQVERHVVWRASQYQKASATVPRCTGTQPRPMCGAETELTLGRAHRRLPSGCVSCVKRIRIFSVSKRG